MQIAVVDYKGGNVQSVLFALERLGASATLTADPETLRKADKVLFPGEGEAASAMQSLRASGLDRVLPTLTQPFLGICLGMQLLGEHSEENDTPLLGLLPFRVRRFVPDAAHKVPHMGWNNLQALQGPLFAGLTEADHVYFVHSYYAPVGAYTTAQAAHPAPFSAAVQHGNFHGVQFHTEKSGAAGTRILANFLNL
ncbi:imidazole glycerol phosphate synthase subunit HisH [Hymenobacter properus]|uniref:Imidazole glycerol phosphate synthase subunit HisH n=1 Tax=Hymenobacter properus TaxID=2791026 RepID=A0A931FGT4_9BACT|nr:imidazole glycerol phosphate synthase subunit HisH [Hymenobacter properus]MBF9140292.1 imidazole glycerol phosphate synthase subunit HisH [Hymenobacter properus]MBR7719099.1 imidazole glycerol phosphate synthase subunit HisH [Microvirga sp. SRT04]